MMTIQKNFQRRLVALLVTGAATTGLALTASGTANAETPTPAPTSTTSDAGVSESGASRSIGFFFGGFLKYKLVSVCILDPGKGRVCEKVLAPK
jgi:hypothetical protein